MAAEARAEAAVAVAAAAAEAVAPPKSEYRSRFGEPEPAFVTWLSVAFEVSACVTADGEAPGFACR